MQPSRLIACAVLTALGACAAAQAGTGSLPDLSLEELMDIRVIATPKFAGRIADIPASVSVLTERDIRTFGWRTLADALRTLAGFNVTYDRAYSYAGVRGLAPPGDFRPRLALLIDGNEMNENVYDSALLGGEFPLDLDLVERIEVIRGPGASVYGGNATMGVINVVTRSGAELDGGEAALSVGSHEARSLRASAGGRSARGLEYLVSASGYDAEGARLAFPEMADFGVGIHTRDDDESRRQFFLKLRLDSWRALLLHSQRDKQVPTGSYGTIFDDPRHTEDDGITLAEVGNDMRLGEVATLASRVYFGHYTYDGKFPYDYEPLYVINHDRVVGQWWGAEMRWQRSGWRGHNLIVGLELRDNTRMDQSNFDSNDEGLGCVDFDSAGPCLDDRRDGRRWSAYAQDEIVIRTDLRATLGLRHDGYGDQGGQWSPRVGLMYRTAQRGTFKLLYAGAHHAPNAYERFYDVPSQPSGNPDLKAEHLESVESTWEFDATPVTHLAATLYAHRLRDGIGTDDTGRNANGGTVHAHGAELSLEHRWDSGAMLRANYTAQHAGQNRHDAPNVPAQMLKANVALPIGERWTLGLEGQAVARRRSESGAWTAGYALANLALGYESAGGHWHTGLGVYNLFDREYVDPTGLDPWLIEPRDGITQDGRQLRLKVTGRL